MTTHSAQKPRSTATGKRTSAATMKPRPSATKKKSRPRATKKKPPASTVRPRPTTKKSRPRATKKEPPASTVRPRATKKTPASASKHSVATTRKPQPSTTKKKPRPSATRKPTKAGSYRPATTTSRRHENAETKRRGIYVEDRKLIGERGDMCNKGPKGVYHCDNCKYGCEFTSIDRDTVVDHEKDCPFDPVKSAGRASRATAPSGYTDKEWSILGA